jgi:hypothetical protein
MSRLGGNKKYGALEIIWSFEGFAASRPLTHDYTRVCMTLGERMV